MLCEEAGLAYVRDYGVQQDQGTAAQFFLKACNANNVSACAQIGVMARDMGNVDAAAEIILAVPDFSRWVSKVI